MVQSLSSVTNNLSNCTRFSSNDTKGWGKGHFYFQMRQLSMETVLSSLTKVGGYVIMDVKVGFRFLFMVSDSGSQFRFSSWTVMQHDKVNPF